MTDTTAQPADFAGMLAERVRIETADRQRNVRRGIAAALVVLLHILAISVFIYSNQVPIIQHIRETIPEAIMWIPMPKPAKPRQEQPPPPPQVVTPVPEVTAPITLPKVKTPQVEAPEEPGGLLGVGRSLACLAGSYENLTPRQQARCLNRPWAFVKKPDGTIVMMPKPLEQPEPHLNAAGILRRQQETAPPCPILSNTPCLGKVMHGDPLGGGPSPF
ncbi:MAG: hypothetical protein JO348_14425 [Alphaproteobacteria bacterium]|nr:hypothetical protein [Alphaproteobacteria bacterium]MBV9420961.1 hypothetical protein [Alphaproteobacteria bacterium]